LLLACPQLSIHCFVFLVFGTELKLSTLEHTTGINKSQTIGSATEWAKKESAGVAGSRKSCRPTLAAENSYLKNRKIEIIIATATDSKRFSMFVVCCQRCSNYAPKWLESLKRLSNNNCPQTIHFTSG